MAIPPDHVLRAAVLWLKLLPDSGVARIRALFATAEEYSALTPTQYEEGLAWLREVDLLDNPRDPVPVSDRVFDKALTYGAPLWLQDADHLIQSPVELPDDVLSAAHVLGIDHDAAFERVMASWAKVDTSERTRIGNAGELALVALLEAEAPDLLVDHVAATRDGLGYDIAVSGSFTGHLEVKTTTRKQRLTIYLSRNEFRAARSDIHWRLILVLMDAELETVGIATVPVDWIIEHVPADRTQLGRWESCKLNIPPDVPIPGVAPAEYDWPCRLLSGETWRRSGRGAI